jgi:hypothetical protein
MKKKKNNNDIMDLLERKLMQGTRLAIKKLIEERKKENGYIIISDKNGKVVKIRASSIK